MPPASSPSPEERRVLLEFASRLRTSRVRSLEGLRALADGGLLSERATLLVRGAGSLDALLGLSERRGAPRKVSLADVEAAVQQHGTRTEAAAALGVSTWTVAHVLSGRRDARGKKRLSEEK